MNLRRSIENLSPVQRVYTTANNHIRNSSTVQQAYTTAKNYIGNSSTVQQAYTTAKNYIGNVSPVQPGRDDKREQANYGETDHEFDGPFGQALRALETLKSLCKLQLKLKYQKWRVVVVRTAKVGKLITCKITCDLHKGEVGLELDTSAVATIISAFIPVPIRTAVDKINGVFKRIPLGDAVAVFQLSERLLHRFKPESPEIPKLYPSLYPSITETNAFGRNIADYGNPVVSLVDALKFLNIVLILEASTVIKIKRKKTFRAKGDVQIDVRQGIVIRKQPRNLFNRRSISLAEQKLTVWTRTGRELKLALEIIEMLKYVKNGRSH